MRRADRLFQIVQILRGGRLITARDLAERLEVSERTIYRDIADLVGSGVPIDGEAGMGYLMRAGYDLPPLMFSQDEIVALVAGARIVQAFGGAKMARGAMQALEKINTVLPEKARSEAADVAVHALPPAALSDDLRVLIDTLERAVGAKTRVSMGYADAEGAQTQRVVRPLGLWFWGQVWTLVAWCELRSDFRMFRIDRIATATDAGPYEPVSGQTLRDFYDLQIAQYGCKYWA